jgi:Uma2 family endonuclease
MTLTTLDKWERPVRPTRRGDPAWPVAFLFPRQGQWSEEEYLALDTNRLVELSDGCLEVLPLPTGLHQLIAQVLYELLKEFVFSKNLGLVFIAPFPVRLWPEKIREPDVVFLRPGRWMDRDQPSAGADLAMEVVSKGKKDRERDLVIKRAEYAQAGIPEYWIVDPVSKRITVLVLQGKKYKSQGEFASGSRAVSTVLPGFEVDVSEVFGVEKMAPPAKTSGKHAKRKPKTNR